MALKARASSKSRGGPTFSPVKFHRISLGLKALDKEKAAGAKSNQQGAPYPCTTGVLGRVPPPNTSFIITINRSCVLNASLPSQPASVSIWSAVSACKRRSGAGRLRVGSLSEKEAAGLHPRFWLLPLLFPALCIQFCRKMVT